MQFLVICQCFLPLVILFFTYTRIGIYVWCTEAPGNIDIQRDSILLQRKRKVANTMVIIVVLFGLCWLPYQVYNLLVPHYPQINKFSYINVIWFSLYWLAMSNSACNPFLYAICSGTFRKELKRRMTCFKKIGLTCVCCGRTRGEEAFELQNRHVLYIA